MLKEYPKFKKGEVEEFYNSLSEAEKGLIKDYLEYRKARGIGTTEKIKDLRRYMLHLRYILNKEYKQIDLKDLRSLLAIINNSYLSNYVKNGIKADLKNFLKYLFPDWSLRFSNLEDIKLISNARNEEKLNSQTLFKKEDIEKLMRHESKMFWKAFLMCQYEAGLRTKEVRFLKWENIKFNVDGDISEINIYATKTKRARPVFVKEGTFYLQKLMEEQENLKQKGLYV
jgi:integrase